MIIQEINACGKFQMLDCYVMRTKLTRTNGFPSDEFECQSGSSLHSHFKAVIVAVLDWSRVLCFVLAMCGIHHKHVPVYYSDRIALLSLDTCRNISFRNVGSWSKGKPFQSIFSHYSSAIWIRISKTHLSPCNGENTLTTRAIIYIVVVLPTYGCIGCAYFL